MHFVIGLLGVVVTVLVLLDRLQENGIDIGWLNPFAWYRRRQWHRRTHTDPLYAIDRPLDVAALLMLMVAKRDGELAASEGAKLLELYRTEFRLPEREASALLTASVHLLGARDAGTCKLRRLLAPSKGRFTVEQAASTIGCMEEVAALDGGASRLQRAFIRDVRRALAGEQHPEGEPA